jgi:hypothetical protein
MKPSEQFANLLRGESTHCHNANASALLQEVAAWLDGGTIFDGERQELWEHADRLCGVDGVKAERCPKCNGLILSINEDPLCMCLPQFTACLHSATIPPEG